eukprot:jgi/Hompol1/6514/HPOL_005019-RA
MPETTRPFDMNSLAANLMEIRIRGSYGVKFDSIVRFILHLSLTQPNEKVLVFSQWERVLEILSQAFKDNGIGYIGMTGVGWTPGLDGTAHGGETLKFKRKGQSVVEFRRRNDLQVFLLNAKSQSSGLTL